jgi:hypothetical protein
MQRILLAVLDAAAVLTIALLAAAVLGRLLRLVP